MEKHKQNVVSKFLRVKRFQNECERWKYFCSGDSEKTAFEVTRRSILLKLELHTREYFINFTKNIVTFGRNYILLLS